MTEQEQELHLRIRELEKQNQYLHQQIKEQRYGLNWIDVPEAFEKDSENAIPILKEVEENSFSDHSDKPSHILIEGDNYHALQCLNYTHKGKIDVIYIDPPYNTGSDGFAYKDKRILTEYPDGTPVPKDHPLRHSYWLSFMSKRLELARNLLSDDGVIFISIDDNEQANLKFLCNKLFDSTNFICEFIRKTKSMTGDDGNGLNIQHEYLLTYAIKKTKVHFHGEEKDFSEYSNPDNDPNGPWCSADPSAKSGGASTYFPIENPYTHKVDFPPKGRYWAFSINTLNEYIQTGRLVFKKKYSKNQRGFILKRYKATLSTTDNAVGTLFATENEYMNQSATVELNKLLGAGIFSYPKPLSYLEKILKYSTSEFSIILDFFAGSGTTLHAAMELNQKDGGIRQCILVQAPETTWELKKGKKVAKKGAEAAFKSGYSTISEVTYERNRRVMQGYTNASGEDVLGLGGSLKYYKTAFVSASGPERDSIMRPSDEDKIQLAQNASELVSLAENTLYRMDELSENGFYDFFTDKNGKHTAIYKQEDLSRFEDFKSKVEKLSGTVTVYMFSWGSFPDSASSFSHLSNVEVKAYPKAILDTYKQCLEQVKNNR